MKQVQVIFNRIQQHYGKYRRNYVRTYSKDNSQTLKDGDQVSVVKTITNNDVIDFARLTKDYNPIHLNVPKAIVHGAFLNGLLSGVLGTKLPGPYTIVAEQTLKFPNPCYVGDSIEIIVKIVSARKIIKCEYTIVANKDKVVLMGGAKLIMKKLEDSNAKAPSLPDNDQ